MLIRPQILAENLQIVRARIARAALEHGRNETSVTLLGVSKGQPLSAIVAATQLGLHDFGENYLQEALPKIAALAGRELTWHFIGQLQSNKTRPVAENFDWVHTLDRLRTAERLSAQRPFHAAPLNVCLQIRLADEAGKGGIAETEASELVSAVKALPRLALRGLMCVPPPAPDFGAQRAWFEQLRQLLDALNRQGAGLDTLSMGMSADLEAAIAAGATIVRIGTALFGERPAGDAK